jgi:hypothetical protein
MKQIITIILVLSLINLVSAYYSGETIIENNPLGTDKINWLIVDNVSAITILPEITFNSTDIIIYFPDNMPPNSFTLVFIEEKTNEVIKEINVGGGSSGTKTVYKNNTIYQDVLVYKDKIVNNESIKEVPIEIIKEINKPFYKNLWFYGMMFVIILSLIFLYIVSNGNR